MKEIDLNVINVNREMDEDIIFMIENQRYTIKKREVIKFFRSLKSDHQKIMLFCVGEK